MSLVPLAFFWGYVGRFLARQEEQLRRGWSGCSRLPALRAKKSHAI